jgi:hypothetical protein
VLFKTINSFLDHSNNIHIFQANISNDEYHRKLEIYEQSVRQTHSMKLLKAHFQDHIQRSESSSNNGGPFHTTVTHGDKPEHYRIKRSAADVPQTNNIHFDMTELWSQLPQGSSAMNGNQLILVSDAVLTLELELLKPSADLLPASSQVCAVQIVRELDGIRLDCVQIDPAQALATNNKIRVDIDISHAVQAWLNDESTNKGLVIQAEGWLVSRANQPIRIQFSTLASPRNVRTKRDLYLSQEFLQQFMQTEGPPAKSECKKGANGRKCCRQHMKVNLRNFEGLEFILQPQEFDAYYCVGKCPARYLPRNDHTLLQSLIHIQNREGSGEERNVKRPCCNPSEYESIDILYLNENDPTKLEVKHWKNIIVSECACA